MAMVRRFERIIYPSTVRLLASIECSRLVRCVTDEQAHRAARQMVAAEREDASVPLVRRVVAAFRPTVQRANCRVLVVRRLDYAAEQGSHVLIGNEPMAPQVQCSAGLDTIQAAASDSVDVSSQQEPASDVASARSYGEEYTIDDAEYAIAVDSHLVRTVVVLRCYRTAPCVA